MKEESVDNFKEEFKQLANELNKKENRDIFSRVAKGAFSKNITQATFGEILVAIKALKLNEDAFNFMINIMVNSPNLIHELGKEGLEDKDFFIEMHEKYWQKISIAIALYQKPEDWKLLNSDIIKSKSHGYKIFHKIYKHNDEVLEFTSTPEDHIKFVAHMIQQLNELPEEEYDKIKPQIKELKNLL